MLQVRTVNVRAVGTQVRQLVSGITHHVHHVFGKHRLIVAAVDLETSCALLLLAHDRHDRHHVGGRVLQELLRRWVRRTGRDTILFREGRLEVVVVAVGAVDGTQAAHRRADVDQFSSVLIQQVFAGRDLPHLVLQQWYLELLAYDTQVEHAVEGNQRRTLLLREPLLQPLAHVLDVGSTEVRHRVAQRHNVADLWMVAHAELDCVDCVVQHRQVGRFRIDRDEVFRTVLLQTLHHRVELLEGVNVAIFGAKVA
ncbi:hypothetical protein D3C86_1433880 [compost metagenome]